MLSKFAVTMIICSFLANLEAKGAPYQWEYSLDTSCVETCSRLEEFTEPVSTYKGDSQVCSKKSLFGMALKPGYKIAGEEGCLVTDLRNRVFQCLCTLPSSSLEWRDHPKENRTCQQTCTQWGQKPVLGENSSFPVCATIIHEQELSGHVGPNAKYCLAGTYTSTIAQCLCQ